VAYASLDQLAAAMRVTVTTKNQEALQRALDSAASEIDHELDRPATDPLPTPAPALVVSVNVDRGVEWFKASDAAWGNVGYADIGVVKVAPDGFARHAATLTPYKIQYGLA